MKALHNLRQFLQAHPRAKKVIKGFAYIFLEKILKFAIGFIVHALVARYLGPTQFGKLSYVTKTVSVIYTFSLFGVDEIILKYLLDKHYSKEDILKSVLGLRFVSSLVGFFILGIFLFISRPESTAFSLLVLAYGLQIFVQAFNVFELQFHAQLSFRPLFWANNISNIFAAFLRVCGVWLKMSVPYFVSTYLLGDILLKLLIQRKLGFNLLKGKFHEEIAIKIAKSSWPFFVAALVNLFDQRISFLFIEEYLSGETLGNYSVAVTLVDLWIFLPIAVCSSLFPTIVSSFNDNRKAYETKIQFLSDIMVWMALFFSIGVFFTADWVVDILYGAKYVNASNMIRWYALITLPMFFNLARMKWLSLENQLRDWLKLSIISMGLNLVLHTKLVPLYGANGAIWSYLISQLIGNLLGCLWLDSSRSSLRVFLKTFLFPLRMIQKLS